MKQTLTPKKLNLQTTNPAPIQLLLLTPCKPTRLIILSLFSVVIELNQPTCTIIAGPNGAGKTTFALDFFPNVLGCKNFVNADLIASGLAPLAPEREC